MMSSTQQSTAASIGTKPTAKMGKAVPRVPTKAYTELLFEYSDGRGYDISAIQNAENNAKITLDPDYQVRWEITLGASLKQNCGSIADRAQYIARFPKGFSLIFDPKKGERHVVGHPGGMGREFWYHDVGELAPHLLWLGAPAPHDRARCSCEPCKKMLGKPKTREHKKPATKRKQPQSSSTATVAPRTPAQSSESASAATGPGVVPAVATAQTPAAVAAPAVAAPAVTAPAVTAPAVTAPAVTAPAVTAPATAPAEAPVEAPAVKAAVDTTAVSKQPSPPPPVPDYSIYRAGELVWFGTQTGIWRIGLILSRAPADSTHQTAPWVVAPLGHRTLNQVSSIKPASLMRPFHAFSLPGIDIPELQDRMFAEVDWPMFARQFANGDARKLQLVGLEASKMAARDANASFSTFNKLGAITPDGQRGSYGGIFLGPEMVRIGDALRVTRMVGEQDGSPDIMEVKYIVDDEDGMRPKFHGDVWRSQVVPLEAPEQPRVPQGIDFVRQLQTTNEVLRLQGARQDWVLVETDGARTEDDVRGRFYVTFDLLPELRTSLMEDNTVQFDDGTQRVNARLRPDSSQFYIGRKESRKATFGDSVALDQLDLGPDVVEG